MHAQSCPPLSDPRMILGTVARLPPLSRGFSRQEHWSGLPFPSPRDLPYPGIEPASPLSPALQVDSLPLSHQDLPPNSIQRAAFRSDALLKTFLCFSASPPHHLQGIKTNVSAAVSGPGRSYPLPPWFSIRFLHSGYGSDMPGRPLPQSRHPGCCLCLEPSSPSNHMGCPPALQMWVYGISFSVRLLSQVSPLKTIVNVSPASLTLSVERG